ncbi:hypothetical protein GE061_012229 [Apolygus lucorum]|uniref:Receptor-mediated endocytosis protein 6 homolog n=1 Tax=Apolygus lucorum TaxID=248454 RepID=A0A8S9XVS9_APOLU|nr:hypothetical protein GE061_012229 [Apolygus lucorum]
MHIPLRTPPILWGSHDLNEKVVHSSSRLAQLAWITSHQRLNLNRLVVSRVSPANCCKRARSLDATKFVDAHSILGYQKCHCYGELLRSLRDNPEMVSRCLVEGDRCVPEEIASLIYSLVAGLYSSCVLPKDRSVVLNILSNLITLQLIESETPRRLLRPGTCAFSCLYSAFHENLYSAKLFLTAALHEPIMKLLMMDENYLDIDPEKVAIRLEERSRLLGTGDEPYKVDLATHRASTVKSLVEVTQTFIDCIRENLHSFPSPVFWLVNQIYMKLTKAKSVTEKEVFTICTDLVFTLFICPAIVKPEPHGITDVPVGAVASFNLIQVAQILQMLALRKYEPIDPRLEDLYDNFDRECVSSIIEFIIEANLPLEYEAEETNKVGPLNMSAALFTEAELDSLVNFLRTVSKDVKGDDSKLQKELAELLAEIPLPAANGHDKFVPISPEVPTKKTNLLAKVGKHRSHSNDRGVVQDTSPPERDEFDPIVLIIPFDMNFEPSIGLDSEQKILGIEKSEIVDKITKIEKPLKSEGQEKRTRFSLSHDDGSIGNTSDNLEVVSEAPSNHSVASSLELENEDQNDNLSDMVSANVSGRGSPNISGRDTPSSQIIEEEEQPSPALPARQQLYYNPPTPKRAPQVQPRFDIDDKFGKFEIKTLVEGADETFSLVSDTWSTDVLASDSEILEQVPQQQLAAMNLLPTLPTIPTSVVLESSTNLSTQPNDLGETASEAWSTDVMASDSEKMTEIDTDDTASVARSDETGGRLDVEMRNNVEPNEPADEPPPPSPASIRVLPVPSLVPNGSVGAHSIQEIFVQPKPCPTPSGAIPKSISFDKTAERGDKESLDEDGKPKRGFFRSLKLPFKNRRVKSFRGDGYEHGVNVCEPELMPPIRLRRGTSEDGRSTRSDTSDDILAKYRTNRSELESSEAKPKMKADLLLDSSAGTSSEGSSTSRTINVFEDAKKKLRLVLSSSEGHYYPPSQKKAEWARKESELASFLHLQLAEALNLNDNSLVPQLYEALRCIRLLNEEECHKLFESLKEDYRKRRPYIIYLINCRQSLLCTLSHLHRLKERVKRDRTLTVEFLSSVCVRLFLEKRADQVTRFIEEFQGCSLADEKCDLSECFLERLYNEMSRDPVWSTASEDQLIQARKSVERCVFNIVYLPAMYPNGDGDIARDLVLHEHISKLANVITPDHKDLRIPVMFHCECPWPSAQAEISKMAAYRSPREKLQCALRCITTIMNLLSLTCVPAADDLVPVLVYVLIMANPPSLMSTIEYVTSFFGNSLEGEEQYYWTQFCSAVEFIKTMDYIITE